MRGGWVSVTNTSGAAIVEPVGTAPQTLPGARKDGTLGLWLEKKSPARGKGWQKRWFVFQADGEVRYFTDPSKENLADAPAAGMYGAAQTPKKKKQVRDVPRLCRCCSDPSSAESVAVCRPSL